MILPLTKLLAAFLICSDIRYGNHFGPEAPPPLISASGSRYYEMKQIPLTQGQVALVDDEDFEWLSQWKWYVAKQRCNAWYAARSINMGNAHILVIKMHRIILKPPPGFETDHKDGNGLNNQRNNLRIATRAENTRNRRKRDGLTSAFKGVHWACRQRKWRASIGTQGKTIPLGYFDNEKVAAKAYDKAARKCFGEFARTNFG